MIKLLINLLFSAAFVGPTIDGEQYLKEYYQWAFEEVKSHAGPMAKHVKLNLTNEHMYYTAFINGKPEKIPYTMSAPIGESIRLDYIAKSRGMQNRSSFTNTLILRFSMAHELAHIIFRHHTSPIYKADSALAEQHANLFGVAVLKSIGYDNDTLIMLVNNYFKANTCSHIHGCNCDTREQMIFQINQYKD